MIYVPGNHEYYRLVYQKQRSAMRKTASQHFNVRLLDQNACVIGGVLFVGCTLWTDFRYFETSGNFSGEEAMNVARRFMPDFSVIRYMDEHGNYMKFKPEFVRGSLRTSNPCFAWTRLQSQRSLASMKFARVLLSRTICQARRVCTRNSPKAL